MHRCAPDDGPPVPMRPKTHPNPLGRKRKSAGRLPSRRPGRRYHPHGLGAQLGRIGSRWSCRRAQTTAEGNHRFQWLWPLSSEDCEWCSSGGSPREERSPTLRQRPASPCVPGTGERRQRETRCNDAVPRHKACQKPDWICPSRKGPSPRSTGCGVWRNRYSSNYGRALHAR